MKRIILAVLLLGVIGVLAYGYRFGATHGALYVTVLDVSNRERLRRLTVGDVRDS